MILTFQKHFVEEIRKAEKKVSLYLISCIAETKGSIFSLLFFSSEFPSLGKKILSTVFYSKNLWLLSNIFFEIRKSKNGLWEFNLKKSIFF